MAGSREDKELSPARANPSLLLKAECADLRDRSIRLRDHSRHLVHRSRQCRRRLQEAATAAAGGPSAAPTERARHVEHLLKVESDLEKAIGECTAALGQVRRELGWHGRPSTTVH